MKTPLRSATRALALAPIVAWAVLIAALLIWLMRTPPPALREQLTRWQFWSLEACAWLVLGTGVMAFRDLRRQVDRDDIKRMAVLAALAVSLVLFVAPRTNRIYYDEQIYQSIGQNLSDLRRAQMCLDGNVEYGRLQCSVGEYNKQPYAYPHLLSLAYRVAGANASWAFAINAIAMALTVCAVYLAALLLFADRAAAFFAGLILTLTPQQLLWSATAAVEPLASLTCVLALLAVALFVRSRSSVSLVAAVVVSAYAVQFRAESLLIIPVVVVVLWHLAADERRHLRLWWAALLGLALVAIHVGHLYSVRGEGWGTDGPRLSLSYVVPNFRVNGRFYVGDERFPVIYTVLAVIGLLASGQTFLRGAMLLYFLVFFGMGLVFYAGSYNYGADVRYSLMTYPPIAILGGLGAAELRRWLERLRQAELTGLVVGAGLVAQFLWYTPVVRATTEEAWAARADVRFAESVAAALPANSYVLTHNPGMFHLWGVNSGQMSLAVDSPGRLEVLATRYAGGVYLHWNFWCNVAVPVQQQFCRRALGLAPSHPFREYQERDQRFALYRFALAQRPADVVQQSDGSRP